MKKSLSEKTRKAELSAPLRALYTFLAVCFWVLVWFVFALIVNNELLLPSPLTVLRRLFELAAQLSFYKSVGASIARILIGIIIAVVLGVLLAVITEHVEAMRIIIQPAMTLIKATPVASFILLALVWISRTVIPAFIVVLIVLPIIWGSVSEGIRNLDRSTAEMLRLFRVPFFKRLRYFYIPSIAPYFRSALLSSSGLAWKSGVAAEVLTVPTYAIGRMLFESKQYLETVDLFAWTLAVIILSYAIERIFSLMTGRSKRRDGAQTNTENGGGADD